MRDCVEVMERAFAEETRGIGVNAPRTRYKVELDLDQPGYMAPIIPGENLSPEASISVRLTPAQLSLAHQLIISRALCDRARQIDGASNRLRAVSIQLHHGAICPSEAFYAAGIIL